MTGKVPRANSNNQRILKNRANKLSNPKQSKYSDGELPLEFFFANKIDCL